MGVLKKIGGFVMKALQNPLVQMALSAIPGAGPVMMAVRAFSAVSQGGSLTSMFGNLASQFLGGNGASMLGAGGNNILSSFLSSSNQQGNGSGGIADIIDQAKRVFTRQNDTDTQRRVQENMASQAAYYQAQSLAA